jgi:hypothetical protein
LGGNLLDGIQSTLGYDIDKSIIIKHVSLASALVSTPRSDNISTAYLTALITYSMRTHIFPEEINLLVASKANIDWVFHGGLP